MSLLTDLFRTDNPDIPSPRRVRHPLQLRPARVRQIEEVGAHRRHITLEGPALQSLESDGFDDHIKLLLPPPGVTELPTPSIRSRGLPEWPANGPQPVARDYTPLAVDRARGRLTLGFYLHGDGPAARWAAAAQVGDAVLIGGPRGSAVWPTDLRWQWLVGDESALPAIQRRLAELPASVDVTVVLDLAHPTAPLPALALGGRTLHIVPRPVQGHPEEVSAPLLRQLAALPRPQGRGFAWVGLERHSARAAHQWLYEAAGLAKGQVRATAYWQRGVSGGIEKLEE